MHRRSPGERLFDGVNTVLMLLLCLVTFYPFYYIIIYSISNPTRAAAGVYLFPVDFTLINYIKLFEQNQILYSALISVSKTVIGTVLTIICCSMFGYSVSKTMLPARRFMYRITVVSMYISIGIIPIYITYKFMGLRNNFLVYILPNAVVPFYIVLLKTYFEQLPIEIEESAMIDGAGYFKVFRWIVLPVSTPIIATVAIFQAVGLWNTYYDNLYFVSSDKLQTLQMTLYIFIQQQQTNSGSIRAQIFENAAKKLTPASVRMTITVIATLPIMLVYPFLQRYFLNGLLLGAIKG